MGASALRLLRKVCRNWAVDVPYNTSTYQPSGDSPATSTAWIQNLLIAGALRLTSMNAPFVSLRKERKPSPLHDTKVGKLSTILFEALHLPGNVH